MELQNLNLQLTYRRKNKRDLKSLFLTLLRLIVNIDQLKQLSFNHPIIQYDINPFVSR